LDLSKFDAHYEAAEKEKKDGNLLPAKKNYYLAVKELWLLAGQFEGEEIAETLKDRAKFLENYADDLVKDQTSRGESQQLAADDKEEKSFLTTDIPDISFDQVAGLSDVKDAIRRRVIDPLKHPDIYKRFNVEIGGGVLLYGLPGNGKTMIAKAIANELNAKFYSIKGSDIVSKWYGDGEKNVKKLFDEARKNEMSIIFFDEFDTIAVGRDSTNSSVTPRIVNELLAQIDGFSESGSTMFLLAATNRPWAIDTGIIRSKRFSELIYIPLPDDEAREYILEQSFRGIPMEEPLDLSEIVGKTEGFSAADVSEFANRCKDHVLKRCIAIKEADITDEEKEKQLSAEKITAEDITETKFRKSVNQKDIDKLEKFRKTHDTKEL